MSWTHYWQRGTELSQAPFQAVLIDLRKLLDSTDIKLAGNDGLEEPFLSLDEISFNGVHGQDCEPFRIRRTDALRQNRDMVYSFCKTEHMPYDLCVKCVLIILKHHFNENIAVSSDGIDKDWQDAILHCQTILGYGNNFKLSPKE
jgi:hypothetical protein